MKQGIKKQEQAKAEKARSILSRLEFCVKDHYEMIASLLSHSFIDIQFSDAEDEEAIDENGFSGELLGRKLKTFSRVYMSMVRSRTKTISEPRELKYFFQQLQVTLQNFALYYKCVREYLKSYQYLCLNLQLSLKLLGDTTSKPEFQSQYLKNSIQISIFFYEMN